MRREHGQSTLEYVAIVLLALAVLAAGLLVTSPSGIAQALVAQMQRAICLVRGGECGETVRAPCVTASTATISDLAARVVVVRLSGGRTVLRERRSDGTVVVRLLSRGGLGLELDAGLDVGFGGLRIGGSIGGLVEGRMGHGRTWNLRSDEEADRLMAALSAQATRSMPRAGGITGTRARTGRPPPEPDETFGEQGLGSELRARLGRAGFTLEAADLIGLAHRALGRAHAHDPADQHAVGQRARAGRHARRCAGRARGALRAAGRRRRAARRADDRRDAEPRRRRAAARAAACGARQRR